MNLATMIMEDAPVVAVIVLFAWLVPVRRNGIPGLGGRGRVRAVRANPLVAAAAETRPQPIRPRPAPAAERISPADAAAGVPGRDRAQDERVLAELDKTWDPGYADRVAAQLRERKGR